MKEMGSAPRGRRPPGAEYPVQINSRVAYDVWHAFKLDCIRRGISMSAMLEQLIIAHLDHPE